MNDHYAPVALPLLLTQEEMESLTGYTQFSAQMRWLDRQFGISPPRRADGFPVLSRSQLEFLLHKKCGMEPPNMTRDAVHEPNWGDRKAGGRINWSKP